MSGQLHAQLSHWAYPSAFGLSLDTQWQETVVKKCSKLGLESDCHWNNDNELLAAWNDKNLYVAFRGTTGAFDWIVNAAVRNARGQLPSAGAHAHAGHNGYVKSLDAVWPYVEQLLADHRGKDLHWTGHSKAGSMASLACSRAWAEGCKAKTCYTFGEPANSSKGLAALATEFQGLQKRRYVHCQDVVPWTPLYHQFRGHLRHWGDVYYFDRNRTLRINHSWFWMFVDRTISLTKGLKGITHHSMEDYLTLTRQSEK